MYKGIDYGLGQTNIDHKTGIRYGVISAHNIGQSWYDESEDEYGPPTCPECGDEAQDLFELNFDQDRLDSFDYAKYECSDYVCLSCKYVFGSESAFGDEPIAFSYKQDGYLCFQTHDDPDIFIEKSPYFTYGQFCSPCAPGAIHLESPLANIDTSEIGPTDLNNRGYCFGHDWFEDGKAPYRIFSVKTGEEMSKYET